MEKLTNNQPIKELLLNNKIITYLAELPSNQLTN